MSVLKPFYRSVLLLLILASCHNGTQQSSGEVDHLTRKVDALDSQKNTIEEQPANTEDYSTIVENGFLKAKENPLSTFSIDVDQAAYSNVRRYIQNGAIPPKGAVRLEEMINYFDYGYAPPVNGDPFAVHTETAVCPWNEKHRLLQVGLKGKEIDNTELPPANLVFLIDVSGSMSEPNKLPLVQSSMKLLINQLREHDKVAIVVYAGAAGLVLPSTSGNNKIKIKQAIDNLEAGGSTAGAAGIQLAYEIAKENFIPNGNNRVILATDGDFNVGTSSDDELVTLIEAERKSNIFLTVLGFGMGDYKDNKMRQLADKGNGNHAYIDNINEAKKVLVNEFGSTLFTIAKDVKIQVEFNPAKVQAYRLIGYENRMLQQEDFNDDKKDAGELGAGHTVTALYEIIPVGIKDEFTTATDSLKYQRPATVVNDFGNEMLTIKLRYKTPTGNESKLMVTPVPESNTAFEEASADFRFAASVASFGMLLRNSTYKQNSSYEDVIGWASIAKGKDSNGYRDEFIQLVQAAAALSVAKK
ncbi:vWA domain-containing protein [Ferruginibacter sp.]